MLLGYLILAGCTQIKIMVEFLFLNQEDEGGVPRKHISKPRLYLLYQSCAEVGKMLTLKKIFLRGRVMAEFFNLGLAPKVRLPSDSEDDCEGLVCNAHEINVIYQWKCQSQTELFSSSFSSRQSSSLIRFKYRNIN